MVTCNAGVAFNKSGDHARVWVGIGAGQDILLDTRTQYNCTATQVITDAIGRQDTDVEPFEVGCGGVWVGGV